MADFQWQVWKCIQCSGNGNSRYALGWMDVEKEIPPQLSIIWQSGHVLLPAGLSEETLAKPRMDKSCTL
jgi:hypothetical protein